MPHDSEDTMEKLKISCS